MSKRRAFLIRILLIIVVIGCLTHTSWGQGNDTVNISHPSSLPARSAFSDEDILNHAQRSLDRSISILNTVATAMGALVGLITLIVVIGVGWGVLQTRRWQEYGEQAKKSAEETKRYADEAKKAAEEAKPIVDRLKKAEEDITISREQSKQLPTPPEELSEDQKKILDEYGTTTELLESFGKRLEPADYYFRGILHYFRNEFQSAIGAFDKAIELQPDYAAPWYNRGVALDKLGRHEEALKAFDKAIELKPDYAEAWYNRGATLGKLGRHDEAFKAYDKATELKPDYATAWYNRGVTLGKLDRYEEALKAFDKAIELKPDYTSAWYNRACAYSRKEDKENALKNLSKAIALDAKFKEKAKSDKDLKNLWEDEDFKRIVS